VEGRQRLAGAFLIELRRIQPDPTQPRKNLDTDAQRELVNSIRQIGILQPITVHYLENQDIYQVITGERRFQAARSLELPSIPCWVQTPKNEDILLHQLVENWQRSDLHPYELADALVCLRDANDYSQKQLAELTGKPESEISRLLSLLKLDAGVQKHTREASPGTFTKRHLTAVSQLPAAQQQQVVKSIEEQHLTAIDTEKLVKEAKQRHQGTKTRGAPFGQRMRYKTTDAWVTLSFRRRNVTVDDILASLEEVRELVNKPAGEK
jgi:ParB family chromosome partitioning protein